RPDHARGRRRHGGPHRTHPKGEGTDQGPRDTQFHYRDEGLAPRLADRLEQRRAGGPNGTDESQDGEDLDDGHDRSPPLPQEDPNQVLAVEADTDRDRDGAEGNRGQDPEIRPTRSQ